MEFYDDKENIQPLAAGRNASMLQASLRSESHQELLLQRRDLENEIHNYSGPDPLEPWFAYVAWIEQSFPSGGKESGLDEVLTKCLSRFEQEECYNQDRRMIKLYIKFIDTHKDPTECYQQLFNAGIGTMVADFYISWAYSYDISGNFRKADEIFRRGIACRAEPLDELKEAHQHFNVVVAQRIMYNDDENAKDMVNQQLRERRLALTSLRGYRRREVGSIRTGSAVKSSVPGRVKTDATRVATTNARVQIFSDENINPNGPTDFNNESPLDSVEASATDSKSVVRSIISSARHQENQKEPGPWNKAHDKKTAGNLYKRKSKMNDVGFEIHEDNIMEVAAHPSFKIVVPATELNYNNGFKYPENFKSKNFPLPDWQTPVTIENQSDPRSFPMYNKCMLYPRPNMELQSEELRAYYWYKKRNIENSFMTKRNEVWSTHDITAPIRQYPNFASSSKPMKLDSLDQYYEPELDETGIRHCLSQIYNTEEKQEFQFEELLVESFKARRNETIVKPMDMDETVCLPMDKIQRRKSFFPIRKSIAPKEFGKDLTTLMENDENSIVQEAVQSPIVEENPNTFSEIPEMVKICEIPRIIKENKILKPQTVVMKEPKLQIVDSSLIDLLEKTKLGDSSVVRPISGFEIYEDPTQSKINIPEIMMSQETRDFHFKAPALPVKPTLPFEIFDENCTPQASGFSKPNPNAFAFDDDETCSTHTFNIFLKSQLMSTPKAPPKVQPRQFGAVLRDIIVPPAIPESTLEVQNSIEVVSNVVSPEISEKPLMEANANVEETSEHGTHSTHTTGSTKSTNISSDCDTETNCALPTRATIRPPIELETVEENSRETSDSISKLPENILNSISLNVTKSNEAHVEVQHTTTTTHPIPASTGTPTSSTTSEIIPSKLQPKDYILSPTIAPPQRRSGLNFNFTIFEDNTEKCVAKVEETDDKDCSYSLPKRSFKENKINKIPKILLNSLQEIQLEDDKNETVPHASALTHLPSTAETIESIIVPETQISAPIVSQLKRSPGPGPGSNFVIFEDNTETFNPKVANNFKCLGLKDDTANSLSRIRFQEDKTETIPKLLLTSHNEVRFQDDKTETVPKLYLQSTLPFRNEEENVNTIPKIVLKQPKNDITNEILDDDLKSFLTTPPKLEKHLIKKTDFSALSFLDKGTPIATPYAKRKCNIQTPESISTLSFVKDTQDVPLNQMRRKDSSNISNPYLMFDDLANSLELPKSELPMKSNNLKIEEDLFWLNKCDKSYSYVPETQNVVKKSEPLSVGEISDYPLPDMSFSLLQKSKLEVPSLLKQRNYSDITLPEVEDRQKKLFSKSITMNNEIPHNILSETFMKDFSEIRQVSKSETKNSFLQSDNDNNHLTNSFLRDFSTGIKNPTNDKDKLPFLKPNPGNVSIKFLNESIRTKNTSMSVVDERKQRPTTSIQFLKKPDSINNSTNFITLDNSMKSFKKDSHSTDIPKTNFFENNPETEVFTTNLSIIKNSTWLPNHGPTLPTINLPENVTDTKNQEDKNEIVEIPPTQPKGLTNERILFKDSVSRTSSSEHKSIESISNEPKTLSVSIVDQTLSNLNLNQQLVPPDVSPRLRDIRKVTNDGGMEMSIYYLNTPKTPTIDLEWDENQYKTPENNSFVHEMNLDQTAQVIEECYTNVDVIVNPFKQELKNAFLEHVEIIKYIEKLPTCKLQGHISMLQVNKMINIKGINFQVLKVIAKGAYGVIYSAKEVKTGVKYALKQERPANYWEYYICLEVHSRLQADAMLPAFMSVDYAFIGNNASVLLSPLSKHGSLITVCNMVKKRTMKNLDEYIAMYLTCELLEIIDHLHAIGIIHADIKADNFLLINKLSYPNSKRTLQLIDFGIAIDMKLFKPNQVFTYACKDKSFKCVEMLEERPWTYQYDLFGLAGVIHVLLFGKYMEIEKRPSGIWMHKSHMPRYFSKNLWEEIFSTLLNIRDCRSMPNLQQLRVSLKEAILENEKYFIKKLVEFNTAISF